MNCGECPVSLMCYTGKLKSMRLCPLCNTLQLDIGAQIKLIHCCKRQCDVDIKNEWFLRYNKRHNMIFAGPFDDLYTTLMLIDPGPAQIAYIGPEQNSLLFIELCNHCCSQLRNKNKEQRWEEIKRILGVAIKCISNIKRILNVTMSQIYREEQIYQILGISKEWLDY